MRPVPDFKTMAKALRAALRRRQIDIPHGTALDIVAAQHGFEDWNVLAAASRDPRAPDPIRFGETCPLMRIFDVAKAREFYLGFLGFTLDWEHRFDDRAPLYAQVSRAGLTLHLTEHHGDATPGSTIFVRTAGLHAYQRELAQRDYGYGRPGIEDVPWGQVMTVIDPFSNSLRFCEDRPRP